MTSRLARDQRRSGSLRCLLFGSSLVLTSGCMDTPPSGPLQGRLGPESATHSADANQTSPAFATGTVSISGNTLLGYFPQKTRVIATVSGSTTVMTVNPSCEATHTYGVGGNPFGEGGTVSISSNEPGLVGGQSDTMTTGVIDVQGQVMLGQLRPGVLQSDCGGTYVWTGTGTGSVTRIDAQLGIGVKNNVVGIITEFNSGYPGRTLALFPLSAPAGMRAVADSTSWLFTPDDGSPPVSACTTGTSTLCNLVTTKSGNVTVNGYANAGPYTSASMHVTVTPLPTVKLTVSKSSVSVGDTIHVTATTAHATTSEILSYRYLNGATGSCMVSQPPAPAACDIVPSKSGVLKVVALLDDQQFSDSVSITVVTCTLFPDSVAATVTDPLLKGDTATQNAVMALAKATQWDSTMEKQAEYGGWMVKNKLTNVISFIAWIPPAGLVRGQCLSGASGEQARSVQRDFVILADMHTHPNPPSNGLLADGPGVTCLEFSHGQFVNRPYVAPFIKAWKLIPGPSDADESDWQATPPLSYPGYVIEPDGISVITAAANGKNGTPPKYAINSCVGRS
jgi:hypothetical protein